MQSPAFSVSSGAVRNFLRVLALVSIALATVLHNIIAAALSYCSARLGLLSGSILPSLDRICDHLEFVFAGDEPCRTAAP